MNHYCLTKTLSLSSSFWLRFLVPLLGRGVGVRPLKIKNKIRCFLCWIFLFQVQSTLHAQDKIKIACIGNSVTYGYGIEDRDKESYPAQLQEMLGDKYSVKNFGHSGATLLKKGHNPYYKTDEFFNALQFSPDIAVIHLGLNDTDPRDLPNYRDDFESDYAWLLDTLKKINPEIKLYICRLTPIFSGHPRFKSGTRDWFWQIQNLIPQIAKADQVHIIDLHTPLYKRPDLFADNLHPNAEGASIIASTVYKAISKNFGGLHVASVFADDMVLQREKPITIYGTANAGDLVTVNFNSRKIIAATNEYGQWKALFSSMKYGGPYQIKIECNGSNILLKNILIGDVWLCSGQSNMEFPLKNAATGSEELKTMKENNSLRLFKLNSLKETDNAPWDSLTLIKTNQLKFFSGQWQICNKNTAENFSAVAYYFGKKIQEQENIPIGLIQIDVGGSPIESWISRYIMENDNLLVDMLNNWRKSDFIMPWVRERADTNLKYASSAKQRHPYEPCYNYDSAIDSLTLFPIKGVVWYQGESNTHNAELYQHSFTTLVNSWRHSWGHNFPFYYVQLSSIDRPSWPYFREVQRLLQKQVTNSGMAVSLDLGDSLNVHPTKKKPVGDRLARLALHYTYHKNITANGPEPLTVKQDAENIIISFAFAGKLSTSDNTALRGFELVNEKGIYIKANATIKNDKVVITIPNHEKIKQVVYAWQPFTRANLINGDGLPASTFSMKLKQE